MQYSIRKYHINECVTFKSTKREFGSLSNMAAGFPIQIYGIVIRNSEALYQALRFPDYPEIQKIILNISSPISAKKFGRSHLEKTRPDWELHRFNIMRFCIAVKFEHNKKRFGEILLNTEGAAIVEYSDEDKVWGASKNGDYYEGTNALGRLLMELREQVAIKSFELKIPNIPNFYLLGKEIKLEDFTVVENRLSNTDCT